MTDAAAGQVSTDAAEVYEEFFVPSLFGPWAEPLCDAAVVGEGQRVLDVACGTGVVARLAQERVGPGGSVVGIDRNPGMLAVARRIAPSIEWREARAEALPLADDAVDAALCQFGLMFFDDARAALKEMRRVTRPGGRIAAVVIGDLDETPGYRKTVDLLDRLFGQKAGDALRAPFCLGDRAELDRLLDDAALTDVRIVTRTEPTRFASIDTWIETEVRGWTLGDLLSDDQFEELLAAARTELSEFEQPDGTVSFDLAGHLVTATA